MKILLLALVLAACAPAEPSTSAADLPGATEPIAVADTGRVDLSAVPANLRDCIPPSAINDPVYRDQRVRFEWIGEADFVEGRRRVLLEYFAEDPHSNELYKPVVLQVESDGSCLSNLPEDEERQVARAMLDANPAFSRRSLRLNVEAMGGADGFARTWKESRGIPVRECRPDEERNCIAPDKVAIYESLGVVVEPPYQESLTAAPLLAPNLQACLPPSVLRSAVSIAEVARTRSGGSDYVLLEWSETSANDVDLNTLLLRVRGETCESLLPVGTDLAVPDVVSDPIADALAEGRIDAQVRRAGGIDAYAEQLRAQNGGQLTECVGPQETWRSCLAPQFADRLRARGVSISDS